MDINGYIIVCSHLDEDTAENVKVFVDSRKMHILEHLFLNHKITN